MPSPYRIGVDGGGTKTECILIDATGTIVAHHTAPGCNPSHTGADAARTILADALATLLASAQPHPPAIASTLLCLAGNQAFWRETASSLNGYGKVETATDALPVLELATGGQPGLVLHAGTGSFVALRAPDGALRCAGGLGWRLGDPGSAHDIGRRALAHALAELQGWATPSALGQLLRETFPGADAGAITAALHREPEPNRRISSLALRVSALAAAGDATARAVVLASVDELHACAVAAATRHFRTDLLNTLRAAVSGPILTQPFVLTALAAKSPFALAPIAEPPVEGVRRLLLRQS